MENKQFESVYKFRSWDNKHHKRLLTHNEICFASPAKFNDPFDCKLHFRYDLECRDSFMEYLRELNKENGNFLSEEELIQKAENAIQVFSDPNRLKEMLKQDEHKINEKYRVFSMTGIYSNNLLWSHYSSDHQGFCVEFNLKKLQEYFDKNFNHNFIEFPIIYNSEAPKLVLSKFGIEGFQELLKYKSRDWEYENEYRFLIYKRTDLQKYIHEELIPKESISKVILGCQVSDEHKKEIIAVLNQYPDKPILEQAIRLPFSYKLIFEKIEYYYNNQ